MGHLQEFEVHLKDAGKSLCSVKAYLSHLKQFQLGFRVHTATQN